MENKHWILRIGDGINFKNLSKYNIWGINSEISNNKYFINNVKKDDILFKNQWLIVACANFDKITKRELGPIIDISLNNKELGWEKGDWDLEINYKNLYNIKYCYIFSNVKTISSISSLNKEEELIKEYNNILKYSKITKEF